MDQSYLLARGGLASEGSRKQALWWLVVQGLGGEVLSSAEAGLPVGLRQALPIQHISFGYGASPVMALLPTWCWPAGWSAHAFGLSRWWGAALVTAPKGRGTGGHCGALSPPPVLVLALALGSSMRWVYSPWAWWLGLVPFPFPGGGQLDLQPEGLP